MMLGFPTMQQRNTFKKFRPESIFDIEEAKSHSHEQQDILSTIKSLNEPISTLLSQNIDVFFLTSQLRNNL